MNKITCIVCPRGCEMTVCMDETKLEVHGNFCPRGKEYATQEIIAPKRNLSTTVYIKSAHHTRLPVRLNKQIDKKSLLKVMEHVKKISVSAPISCGQVISENVLDSGVSIIATRTILL